MEPRPRPTRHRAPTRSRAGRRAPRWRSASILRWLGGAALLAIALSYIQPVRSYLHARSEVAERRAEVTRLEDEKRELERRLSEARTDAFVERAARRLGLVRPGERLFIVTGIDRKSPGAKGGVR